MSAKELEAGTVAVHVERHDTADFKKEAFISQAPDEQIARYTAGPPIEIDGATNKRLFWKINRRILVIQLVTYFCQSLDKGTLNFASIMGIKKDAHLIGQEVGFQLLCSLLTSILLTCSAVPMARNDPVYWHSLWRISHEFPPPKASSGEDAFRQRLHLGRRCGLFCCIHRLPGTYGRQVLAGFF